MAYQFKVTLQDIEPPIWRRIRVSKNCTLQQFALAIIDAMQWFGISTYRFILEKSILVPDPEAANDFPLLFSGFKENDPELARVHLDLSDLALLKSHIERLHCEDDLAVTPIDCILACHDIEFEYTLPLPDGSGWMHTIEFEGEYTSDSTSDSNAPVCIAGERACPPDNLKGCARSYNDFLKIVMNRDDPNREETLYFAYNPDVDWEFDSEKFDITKVRFRKIGPKGTNVEYWN